MWDNPAAMKRQSQTIPNRAHRAITASAALVSAVAMGIMPACVPLADSGSPVQGAADGSYAGKTNLSKAEAITIASNAALREGRKLFDYAEPYALYSRTEREDSWAISFKGKTGRPGDHFVVQVDDRTGWTRFFAGR